MSRIRTIALGLALTAVSAAAAAAQSTTTPPAPAGPRGAWGRDHRMHQGGMHRLFNGVDLTDAQKTQVRAIHQKYGSQFKALRDSMRPAMDDVRQARQRGDSAAARAAWDRTTGGRDKIKALHDREIADIRAILTPTQRTKLDANLAAAKDHRGKHRGEGRVRKS